MTIPIKHLVRLLELLLLSLLLICQPAWADQTAQIAGQNAVGEPIQQATDSDLSDIPNLERVDYDSFRETFGDVPGEHVPLINPDNEKVQIKQKISGSEKTITTEDLQQN